MKLKFHNYYKLGLGVFILLLVGMLGFNNTIIKVSAAGDDFDTIEAKSTGWSISGYTHFNTKDYDGSTIIESGQTLQVFNNIMPVIGKKVIVKFDDGMGGDMRGVPLYEKWVEIQNLGEVDSYYIYGDGELCGIIDISDGNFNLIIYGGGTDYWYGLNVTLYYKDSPVDNLEPIFESEKYVYITSVSSPVSIPNMMISVGLKAIDAIDGDITDRIIVTSDGNYNTAVYNKTPVSARTLGDYAINFSVTDNSNNTATATITIRVVDTEKPVINTGASTLTYNTGYGSPAITDATILNGIVATDNFSTVTKTITVNNYKSNAAKVGSYTVTVLITDTVGNSVTTTVTITVYDNVKPVFTGSNSFYKSYDVSKSINDIIAFLNIKAVDAIDGDLTIANGKMKVQSDTYTGKANIPGTYTVVLRATDVRGNYADFTITVSVGDDVIPYFLINKNKVIIESGINFTSNMLIKTLKDVGVIKNQSLSFTVVNDTYSGNEDEPGNYNYDLKVLYQDGYEEYVELEVQVLEREGKGTIVEPEKDGFFKRIANWFTKVWKSIVKFFKNPFGWFDSILFNTNGLHIN